MGGPRKWQTTTNPAPSAGAFSSVSEHSLAADEEINAVLPDKLEEFDEALPRGERKEAKANLNDAPRRK